MIFLIKMCSIPRCFFFNRYKTFNIILLIFKSSCKCERRFSNIIYITQFTINNIYTVRRFTVTVIHNRQSKFIIKIKKTSFFKIKHEVHKISLQGRHLTLKFFKESLEPYKKIFL